MLIYMRYEGIFGPVTKAPYTGWIELNSIQWGSSQEAAKATEWRSVTAQ